MLDNDAGFLSMPIPELAAKCREFLVNRAGLANCGAGVNPANSSSTSTVSNPSADTAFNDYWLKWPLMRWMVQQSGRR
jgi:hypothetical protein